MEYSKEKLLTCAENGIYYKHHYYSKTDIYYLSPEDLLVDFANERLVSSSEWEDCDDPKLYTLDTFKLEDYGKEWSMNKEDLL